MDFNFAHAGITSHALSDEMERIAKDKTCLPQTLEFVTVRKGGAGRKFAGEANTYASDISKITEDFI